MHKKSSSLHFLFPAIVTFFVFSCGQHGDKQSAAVNADSSSLFSAKAVIKYAKGLRIDYHDHYKEVSILNRTGDRDGYLTLPVVAGRSSGASRSYRRAGHHYSGKEPCRSVLVACGTGGICRCDRPDNRPRQFEVYQFTGSKTADQSRRPSKRSDWTTTSKKSCLLQCTPVCS